MQAREYLELYTEYSRRIKRLEDEVNCELRLLNDARKNTKFEKGAYTENLKRWHREALQYRDLRSEILETIKSVPGIEGEILYQRYVLNKKWEDICEEVAYSWSSIFKIHDVALQIVQSALDKKTS